MDITDYYTAYHFEKFFSTSLLFNAAINQLDNSVDRVFKVTPVQNVDTSSKLPRLGRNNVLFGYAVYGCVVDNRLTEYTLSDDDYVVIGKSPQSIDKDHEYFVKIFDSINVQGIPNVKYIVDILDILTIFKRTEYTYKYTFDEICILCIALELEFPLQI